jgi:hypothetical protein
MNKTTKDFLISVSPSLQKSSRFSESLLNSYHMEELFRIAIVDCFLAKQDDSKTDYLRELYRREIKKELF